MYFIQDKENKNEQTKNTTVGENVLFGLDDLHWLCLQ